ncbi:MAG TPA: right-handed parallel beta-helix repeat-containing protein [Candidatus Binatia bacterium]|nr:right-handed parallel beta-helix repeat-containing protein [Candidatus Binatia bacterium]
MPTNPLSRRLAHRGSSRAHREPDFHRRPRGAGRPVAAAGVAAAIALLALAASAPAKECGGAVPCECGDRMIESTTLTVDLTNCRGRGLEVRSGLLDCDGHLIAGPGDRFRGEGIWLNKATGVAVRNCVVRNFNRGILVDGTTDSVIDHAELFNNQIGIWVGEGSVRNEIRNVQVHDNRDEGIHLGGGSSQNLVTDSEMIANKTENLYLIQTSSNRVINNLFDRSTEASVHLKHAKDNFFSKNLLAKRNIMVRGDSSGNVFQNNQLYNGRFSFLAIEEDDVGFSYPHDNTVKGGRVLKAGTCFMFIGAYNNTATSVLADNCRPMQEKNAGDVVPYGNSVDLNFIGGGSGGGGSGGGGGGGGGTPSDSQLPKGTIKFDDPGHGTDSLKIKGYFLGTTDLDALHEDVVITFSDAGGTIWSVSVPAGTLRESGRSAVYEKDDGGLAGVDAIEIRRESINSWSFRLAVTDDLSAANEALMTITWQIGASSFSFPDTWTQTSEGWRLR